MVFHRPTREAAEALARELRALHRDTDWRVQITPPLFRGDSYMIVVA